MSELDFEVEIASTKNYLLPTNADNSFEKDSKQAKSHCIRISICSESEEFIEENLNVCDQKKTESEDGAGVSADLEEGEINDSNTEEQNEIVCRFFQNGNCRFGQQCRFIHIGDNAYKMFDSSAKCLPTQPPVFHPSLFIPSSVPTVAVISDSWEQGLLEAKKLLLSAKDKKQNDLDFEEKKLYLSAEEKELSRTRDSHTKKTNGVGKRGKESKSREIKQIIKSDKPKSVVKESKQRKFSKTVPSSQSWIDPWRRSRSRTRNRSRSFSSSSSQSTGHRPGSGSSYCSLCNSASEEDSSFGKRFTKSKTKLDRVYARTFSDSGRRSDFLMSPCLPKRTLYRSMYKKPSACRSYSRSRSSSAEARRSNLYTEKKSPPLTPKIVEIAQIRQQQKRKVSPDIQLKNSFKSGWESCSSDMTVSSLNCTSLSDSNTHSSVDDSPARDAKQIESFVERKHNNSLCSDENLLQSYRNIEFCSGYTRKNDKIRPPVKKLKLISSPEVTDKNVKMKTDYSKTYTNDKIISPVKKFKLISSPEVTSKNVKMKTAKNSDSSKQIKKGGKMEKILSDDENQLRYAPLMLNNISSNSTPTHKAIRIHSKPEMTSTVSGTSPVPKSLSRREHLLMQLRAVELAIAKRKKMVSPF